MITEHFKSELKQLPLILCKLIGGVMAVIGFTGVIFILTRKPAQPLSGILAFLVVGISGLCVFTFSSSILAKQVEKDTDLTPAKKDQTQTSLISWLIFSILAAIFLLVTYIIIR